LNTVIDVLEIAASCAYARWLKQHKGLEPKMTFLEVIFGVGYTLGFSTFRGLLYGGSWWDQSRRFAHDLALASAPIIAGEIEQWVEARKIDAEFDEAT
jgi:hypothetical protein